MKRVIVICICAFLMLACANSASNNNVEKADTGNVPELIFNKEVTYVMDLLIEEDYVMLPLYKVLRLCDAKFVQDPRFDNYHIWCMALGSNQFVINWDSQIFIMQDDYDRLEEQLQREDLIWEEAETYSLLPESGEGPDSVFWVTREIMIGNKALIDLLDQMGIRGSIRWDAETWVVELECRG